MPTITTKDGTEIFYKDYGAGQLIVFHHGWPLSSGDWDAPEPDRAHRLQIGVEAGRQRLQFAWEDA